MLINLRAADPGADRRGPMPARRSISLRVRDFSAFFFTFPPLSLVSLPASRKMIANTCYVPIDDTRVCVWLLRAGRLQALSSTANEEEAGGKVPAEHYRAALPYLWPIKPGLVRCTTPRHHTTTTPTHPEHTQTSSLTVCSPTSTLLRHHHEVERANSPLELRPAIA